ncbi:MAG: hypothetical protein J6Y62_01450 [Clostridia bacterium]|nr:hypothetical protein [Clostridia bacterium]
MNDKLKKFERVFEQAGEIQFDKFRMDSPDVDMLIVKDENEHGMHLKYQAAGMFYLMSLYSQCDREFRAYERQFKYRYNEMYAAASKRLVADLKKNNVRDIENQIMDMYGAEVRRMQEKLDELEAMRDNVAAFLEGWKQKSYVLSSMTQMILAGVLTPREAVTEEQVEEMTKGDRSRKILKRNKDTDTEQF